RPGFPSAWSSRSCVTCTDSWAKPRSGSCHRADAADGEGSVYFSDDVGHRNQVHCGGVADALPPAQRLDRPAEFAGEFGRPIETLRWGQRVRDPAAMNLITVADVVAKIDAAFAVRGIRPVA